MRSDDLILNEPAKQEIDLNPEDVPEAVRHAHVVSSVTPWVAVVVPHGSLGKRREITGSEIGALPDTSLSRTP